MISKRLNHIFTVGCFHSNVKVVYHFKTKKYTDRYLVKKSFNMANFKCLTMFWLVMISVNLFIISFKEVRAQNLAIGQRCKRDNQCNSGNCCGGLGKSLIFLKGVTTPTSNFMYGLGIWKRCWECCKNNDCPAGQKCK